MFNIGDNVYKFTLIRRLGGGGFGEVWLANDKTIDKEIALKIIPTKLEEVTKLLEEARIGNKFNHQNLLQIHYADIIQDDDKTYTLIAQDYQENGTVEKLLNAHNFLIIPDLLKILKDVLLGLEYLHNGNVIHNDIKPSNILLDKNSNGILADYGISGITTDNKPIAPKNIYLIHGAPETISDSATISVSTDIYQAGCTAYRLANGISELRNEFLSNRVNFQELKKKGKIPSRNHRNYVPNKVASIINKAVSINPIDRYSSVLEMRRALEKCNFPGYWTTDINDSSSLMGVGKKYHYRFNVIPKPKGMCDFEATKTNMDGKTTRISDFCCKNITNKEKEKLESKYFEWVINNAT